MTTTAEIDHLTGNSTKLSLELLNSGDEPAYSVQASLILPEYFDSQPLYIENINSNESFKGNINIQLKQEILFGNYILPILVEYADGNGYPFSSISSILMNYNKFSITKAIVSMPESIIPIEGKKEVEVTAKNIDDFDHDLKVSLFLPREITSDQQVKRVSVKSKDQKTVKFELENLGALEGSTYNIVIGVEYDDSDEHHSYSSHNTILISGNIEEQNDESIPFYMWALILSFFLILIYIYFKVKK